MTGDQYITLWAQLVAWAACFFLGLRANMLKPQFTSVAFDTSPPTYVWLALMLQSMVLAGAAISLATGGVKAEAREAVVYTACAISAAVMLWNLMRQKPARSTV